MLQNCDQNSLAYVTAVVHGLNVEAETINQSLGNEYKMVYERNDAFFLKAPVPVMPIESNWPLLAVSKVS